MWSAPMMDSSPERRSSDSGCSLTSASTGAPGPGSTCASSFPTPPAAPKNSEPYSSNTCTPGGSTSPGASVCGSTLNSVLIR